MLAKHAAAVHVFVDMGVRVSAMVLLMAAVAAPVARADVSPGVGLYVPRNAPLSADLRPVVRQGIWDEPVAGTAFAYLRVGATRIAKLGPLDVPAATRPVALSLPVSADVRARAKAIAKRDGVREATLTFSVTQRDAWTGADGSTFSTQSPLRLVAGDHPRRPIRIPFGGESVDGDASVILGGFVSLAVPRGWLHTSAAGARYATFGPIALVGGCAAYVTAFAYAWASRSPADVLGPPRVLGDTVATSRGGPVAWRVYAGAQFPGVPQARAKAMRRYARHRFAGVRVYLEFAPGCSSRAGSSPALVRPLARMLGAVRTVVRPHRYRPAAR